MFEIPTVKVELGGFKAYAKKRDLPKVFEVLKGGF